MALFIIRTEDASRARLLNEIRKAKQQKKPASKPKLKARIARHLELKRQFKLMNRLIKLAKEPRAHLHIFPAITKQGWGYRTMRPQGTLDPQRMNVVLLEALNKERTMQMKALNNKGFVTSEVDWKIISGPGGKGPYYYLVNFANIKWEKPRKI